VIRILIVDDHPVFRAGIVNLLGIEPEFEVVGQAASGEAALAMLDERRPDIILLDLSMRGIDGFEALRRIRAVAADVRVIVLTSSDAAEHAARAAQAGADGYLTKLLDHTEIVAAIRGVHAGQRQIGAGLAPGDPGLLAAAGGLTPREIEVLRLARSGASNAEIGQQLGITVRTVKAHMTAILEKLGASDRAGALVRAFELGILKV
jgi:DNA-binding NarL/FixJ family response regulator